MAKRAARRAKLHAIDNSRIHNLVFDQAPANDRDQSYIRKIRPRSNNQRVLMEAIEANRSPSPLDRPEPARPISRFGRRRSPRSRLRLAHRAVAAGGRSRRKPGLPAGRHARKARSYLRPLWDALNDRLGAKRLRQLLDDGTIEIAPVAFMRGRTLNNSFVLIDEAQNCTYGQLKMLLTRLGWHSTMVMTGDPDQTDLLPELSGPSPGAWKAWTTSRSCD